LAVLDPPSCSTLSSNSLHTVTASLRSIMVNPNVVFLGDRPVDDEITLGDALDVPEDQGNGDGQPLEKKLPEVTVRPRFDWCDGNDGAQSEDLTRPSMRSQRDQTFDDRMLVWLAQEQRKLGDKFGDFVKSEQNHLDRHRQHLEKHRREMEMQLSRQRVHMKKALSEARRKAGTSSSSVASPPPLRTKVFTGFERGHHAGSLLSETNPGSALKHIVDSSAHAVTISASATANVMTHPKDFVNRQWQRISVRTSLTGRSVRRSFFNGDGTRDWGKRVEYDRGSVDERAQRLHEAYRCAARTIQDSHSQSRVGRLTHLATNKGASLHATLLDSRFCGLRHGEQVVDSHSFQLAIASLTLLNSVFIGISSDMVMQSSMDAYINQSQATYADVSRPGWVEIVDVLFNMLFLSELVLRMVSLGGRFCAGPDWRWNLFDTTIVVLSIAEMSLTTMGINPSFMRVLRVVRILRSLRMLRLMRFAHLIRKLRFITLAIVNCSTTLMWAVLVLVLVTFVFSILFLNASAQYIADAEGNDLHVEEMRVFFGSLFMTMLTLFMAVAGGIDWWDVVRLLLEIHAGYALVFLLFVVITVLAVLNVINAIFVNDAMESARTDVELRMEGELDKTRFMLQTLTSIFREMESQNPNGGVILEKDFVQQVESEEVKMQFALMGVHFTDGLNFFKFLDVDGNKELAMEEFVMGCLRLKSGALLIDSNVLIQETKALVKSTARSNLKVMASLLGGAKDSLVASVTDACSGGRSEVTSNSELNLMDLHEAKQERARTEETTS